MEALKMNNKYDRQHIKTSYKVKLTCINLGEARAQTRREARHVTRCCTYSLYLSLLGTLETVIRHE